jgi:hypothetical protein
VFRVEGLTHEKHGMSRTAMSQVIKVAPDLLIVYSITIHSIWCNLGFLPPPITMLPSGVAQKAVGVSFAPQCALAETAWAKIVR